MASDRGVFPEGDGYASSSSPTTTASSIQSLVSRYSRMLHAYLDKTTLYLKTRWLVFFLLLLLYIWRVWWLQGYFVVTYGLGIYLLNLLIGFISPQVDPETEELVLPVVNEAGEYRPFQRQLLEFKCWTAGVKAVLLSLFLTCISAFDLPVFWPILLIYFILLFVLTMKQQIKRMIKYKYLPFSWGKQTYGDITRSKPTATSTTHSNSNSSSTGGSSSQHPSMAAAVAGGVPSPSLASTSTNPATKAATAYLKTQQQQQRNLQYYYQPTTTAPGLGVTPQHQLSSTVGAACSPAMTYPNPKASATATAFTASEHFTTPYVLR